MTALMFVFSGLLVILDQWSKFMAMKYLSGQPAVPIWPDVFELRYLDKGNSGVAWGLLSGQMRIIIPLTCLTMLLIVVMLLRSDLRRSKMFNISLAMILGGGVGNLIDRVTFGTVVDFLYFKYIDFPIFNVADCFVVIGAMLLFVYLLFMCKDEDLSSLRGLIIGSKSGRKETADDSADATVDCADRTDE